MNLIGRKQEIEVLKNIMESKQSEFVVVYGRRRVGKTFLIDEFFNKDYSFYATGLAEGGKASQLKSFEMKLSEYGFKLKNKLKNWFDAFSCLIQLLEDKNVKRDITTNKRIIFLDELPWIDTPKSDFKSAFDYFWNSFCSKYDDIVLIICGSATSWIINNLLSSTGGFYKRVTRKIYVSPFSLKECEQFFNRNNINYNKETIVEAYMVFGGIPYYLNLLNYRLSLAQNIEYLFFMQNAPLKNELNDLLASLYKNHSNHLKVIRALAKNKKLGLSRNDIVSKTGLNGETLTSILLELEECTFIRKYNNYLQNKKSHIYQLIDPFIYFALDIIENQKTPSWMSFINTPTYYAWKGNSFELVCLNNIESIKEALGINKIETNIYSWRSKKSLPGAQIDLLIDRGDQLINLCEMKFSSIPFSIDKKYEDELQNKLNCFINETKTKKSVHLTMITSNGLNHNLHFEIVLHELVLEDLFY